LLEHQDDNPFRVAAYRRAADSVAALATDLRELLEAGGIESLQAISGIGPRIAGRLAELARTGRWTYLERLRGSGEAPDVFCAIPGVGPTLAKRLHETLHVETLEQLEAALHEKVRQSVAGIGPRRLAMLRAALSQMLGRIRPIRTGPSDEPPVDMLLDVDREYRANAAADRLRKIAPKRFKARLGCQSCIPTAATGTSLYCIRIPHARMNSTRYGTGSFSIFIPTAGARRSARS
jgi:predicted flap endonuclease-1-like 5' DNA nuclease